MPIRRGQSTYSKAVTPFAKTQFPLTPRYCGAFPQSALFRLLNCDSQYVPAEPGSVANVPKICVPSATNLKSGQLESLVSLQLATVPFGQVPSGKIS